MLYVAIKTRHFSPNSIATSNVKSGDEWLIQNMISYLKGQVKQININNLLVVAGAVGYQVAVPEYWLAQVKEDQEVELYTHLHFSTREEEINIYGFPSQEELHFFEMLISVTGVGRRSAMSALSIARVSELKKTIGRGDSALLQKVAGIGKKTAERIVVELKDKIIDGSGPAGDLSISGADSELIGALENLGYKLPDIREVLRQLPDDFDTSEAKVKAALKMLGKK